ncbi:MAG: hypothetical protein IJP66_04750, partial [Kiritimatiellae bacterium]|nr:hypothetical protein [Kiritimatiellia bacterium]
AELTVTSGAINTSASDKDEGWDTVPMRNAAHVRQVEVSGTGNLAYSVAFSVEDAGEPPVITVDPDDDPHVFPVGSTSTFTVTASDGTLAAGDLPAYAGVSATFADGVFSWAVPALSAGGRTNDIATNVTFTASNAAGDTTQAVNLSIPWDADGNGLSDDWELSKLGDLDADPAADPDEDNASNYDEWVAGTDPLNADSYIGWTSQFANPADGTFQLTFQSVPGATYVIEWADSARLLSGAWTNIDTVASQGYTTTWTDAGYADRDSSVGLYRIRVPFFPR